MPPEPNWPLGVSGARPKLASIGLMQARKSTSTKSGWPQNRR